jgi:pimeloyl-ACP methyl ester carboxylesterase
MLKRFLIAGLAILYLAYCVVLAVVLGEFALHPARIPVQRNLEVQAAMDRLNTQLKEVAITVPDGIVLKGWFLRPKSGIGDAVILLHGVGTNSQGMLGLAEIFLANGYVGLLPDSRGQGASDGIPTYGVKEKEDICHWFSWLRSYENPRCIFGMGESMGAAILLQSIKETPFCAVIAESSFANFRDIAYVRVGQFFGAGAWLGRLILRPAVEGAFIYCRLKYGVALSGVSPEKSVVGNRVPILLIHGLSDSNIPIRQSEKIARKDLRNITLWRVPGAGHCGAWDAAGAEYAQRILAWFRVHRSYPGFRRAMISPGRGE